MPQVQVIASSAADVRLRFVHAALAGSYGGWAYGYRYLLPVQPLLLFAAGAVLELPRARALLLALLPVSVLFAGLGAYHPWPPGYEQASNAAAVAALRAQGFTSVPLLVSETGAQREQRLD